MPFHYVLADLLAKVPGAVGVLFLDDSGETIDVATTDYSPEDLKVFAAYLGIALRQTRSLLAPLDLAKADLIHLRRGDVNIHAVCLPDEYYLVLLQSFPNSGGVARHHLRVAMADLERELFV